MPSNPLIVVAGQVCLDVIPALPPQIDLIPNTLTRIGPAATYPGGCVANVGLALHRLGTPVRLLGKVGSDSFGRLLLDQIRQSGPTLADSFVVADGEATSYSIVIGIGKRDRLFWHCAGVNDTFGPEDIRDKTLADATWFHLGYPPIMKRLLADNGEACAAILRRAKSHGMSTSIDFCSVDPKSEAGAVNWPRWLANVLPLVDLAVPSFDEIAWMLNAAPTLTQSSVRQVARQLLQFGAGSVAIKMGEQGLFYQDAQQELLEPCFEVDVAGTTGAGDCTIAGLISALASGETIPSALQIAAAVGASCCEQVDATSGIRSMSEIQNRIRNGWVRKHSFADHFHGH